MQISKNEFVVQIEWYLIFTGRQYTLIHDGQSKGIEWQERLLQW